MIAVSKPAGLAVIAGRGSGNAPLNHQVESYCGGKIYTVHRLDKDASGLVVFAKDEETHRSLCLSFERRRVRKKYLVLVSGAVKGDGAVRSPLRPFGSGRMGIGPGGRPSETRYSVRDRRDSATLLEVEPTTGRRHQIRVHLYSIGHPVIGDALYGNPRPVAGASRLMLHALSLSWPEKEWPDLVAPVPEDFIAVLKGFGFSRPAA